MRSGPHGAVRRKGGRCADRRWNRGHGIAGTRSIVPPWSGCRPLGRAFVSSQQAAVDGQSDVRAWTWTHGNDSCRRDPPRVGRPDHSGACPARQRLVRTGPATGRRQLSHPFRLPTALSLVPRHGAVNRCRSVHRVTCRSVAQACGRKVSCGCWIGSTVRESTPRHALPALELADEGGTMIASCSCSCSGRGRP